MPWIKSLLEEVFPGAWLQLEPILGGMEIRSVLFLEVTSRFHTKGTKPRSGQAVVLVASELQLEVVLYHRCPFDFHLLFVCPE